VYRAILDYMFIGDRVKMRSPRQHGLAWNGKREAAAPNVDAFLRLMGRAVEIKNTA